MEEGRDTKECYVDSTNKSRTVGLANARFLQASKSTTKRASSPASLLSERQKVIKRARSEGIGSLKHFDGVSRISTGLSEFSVEL